MKTIDNVKRLRPRAGLGRIPRAIVALTLVGLFTAACDDATGPETLSSLTVAPTTETVAVGETVQFTATGTRAGVDVTNLEGEEWSVTGGGTINDAGLFTAGTTPGTSTITVTCAGISTTATVIVTAGPLASITVTPNPATLAASQTQQFEAVGRDTDGNIVEIEPAWSVVASGGSIAPETGLFTAGNTSGTYENTVVATQGTISGTATVVVTTGPLAAITVTPNPVTLASGNLQQFTAVGTDAAGNVVALTPTWSVTNGGGTINSTTGVFTAGNTAGTFENTVRATQGSISGTATVAVTVAPLPSLATITVTPNPVTMATGAQQQFTAVGRDADGNVVAINPTWSVTNGGGTINSNTGVFTAGTTPGTFVNTVRASQGSISGTATVTVTETAPPLATITVTPNPVTMATGAQQQFTATGRDADGNVVAINPTWSVTNGGGTINSSTGLFTAGNTAGTFENTVRATDGTIFGTATVTVTSDPAPPPSSNFTVLANASVTCTDGSIVGDVGTFQASPGGSISLSSCPITNGTPQVGTTASIGAYNSFVDTYNGLASTACGTVLTGTLAGQTLAPGVYCFDAAASLTGTLTLDGSGSWLFKIGTSGTGALSGTNFNVVMAGGGSACSVTWRVKDGTTMTDSNLKGNILSGAGVTLTRGTQIGDAFAQADATITGTAVTGC